METTEAELRELERQHADKVAKEDPADGDGF